MATYSRVKTWSSNETLTSSDLNAEFNNIITNTNSGNLNSDNVSTSATWTWTGTHTMSTSSKLAIIDNIYVTFGSATDGDYFMRYNASNTALELSTTNADGSGTNAVVLDIQDGTDDVRVRGGLSTNNATAPTTGIKTGGPVISDTTNTDALGSTSVTWSDLYLGDSAVLAFGEDQDVTLTHDPDDGIFLNAGMKLAFRDMGGEYIYSVSDGTLGIAAATEVDITTTTLDLNGVLDVSGNATVGGTLGVTGVGTFTAQSVHTGGIQSGSNIVSDTDGTDDLGTTSVRWANVYTDAVGDSGQALGVKATTLSFDAASTIDTSGNNALTLDAGSAVLTLDGGTIESDASTFSFDAAATIDTSGNNNLTLNAGTGTLVATAGDMTLFDDNNNADVSLSMGTSATEALVIQALNGGSNKTLEELRFTTKTASGTGDHGKISFHIDEEEIATIDDGGIDLASGLSFSVAGSAIGGSVAADDITTGDGAVSLATTSGNITIDAQANDADVIIKVDDGGSAVTALTLDGSDEGNAIFVNDVQLKSDSAVLEFGADLDTTLTHTDGTGLTLNSTNKLTFGDAASFIQQSSDGTLRIDGEAIIDLNASTRVDVSGDLKVGGEVQTANIGYTDGDNAITIADGGGCTFSNTLTVGVDDTGHDVKFFGATSGKYMLWDESADTLNVVGNAGVGIARTDGTLHVHTATAGSVAAESNADDLVVENNAAGGISLLTPDANDGILKFGSPANANNGAIAVNNNSNDQYMQIQVDGSWRMWLDDAGMVGVNDNANGFMTQGLTIQQGTNDNELMAFKSSTDVNHNMTSLAEADTYGVIQKQSGTAGGVSLRGFADTADNPAVTLISYMTGISSTKSASGNGAIGLQASLTNGSGGAGSCASDDNLVCIHNHGTTRFIFDAEGSAHAEVEWTTFDTHDDIAMLHDIEATMVPDTFGKAMKYDQEYLMKIGILGKNSLHEEMPGRTRGMINTTKLSMLHHGAIRQVHQQLQDVKEFYEDKIAALEQRLLRLEA